MFSSGIHRHVKGSRQVYLLKEAKLMNTSANG